MNYGMLFCVSPARKQDPGFVLINQCVSGPTEQRRRDVQICGTANVHGKNHSRNVLPAGCVSDDGGGGGGGQGSVQGPQSTGFRLGSFSARVPSRIRLRSVWSPERPDGTRHGMRCDWNCRENQLLKTYSTKTGSSAGAASQEHRNASLYGVPRHVHEALRSFDNVVPSAFCLIGNNIKISSCVSHIVREGIDEGSRQEYAARNRDTTEHQKGFKCRSWPNPNCFASEGDFIPERCVQQRSQHRVCSVQQISRFLRGRRRRL